MQCSLSDALCIGQLRRRRAMPEAKIELEIALFSDSYLDEIDAVIIDLRFIAAIAGAFNCGEVDVTSLDDRRNAIARATLTAAIVPEIEKTIVAAMLNKVGTQYGNLRVAVKKKKKG